MNSFLASKAERYSAKKMTKPVNFTYVPGTTVESIFVVGDFNEWSAEAHPMRKHVDGSWKAEIPLHHGHHRYIFLVDGKPVLDPRAQGTTRNENDERVSLISIS